MFEEKLCQIGLTGREAKVYLELLRIGPQAVSVLARRTKLNRSTIYSILTSLSKKGLVGSYVNKNVNYFLASDPNCLIGYLDGKCRTYDYYRTEMLEIIPKFRTLNNTLQNFKKPVVSYFEGIEGVKYVMNDALKTESELLCYLPLHKWLKLSLKDFLLKFKKSRIDEKKMCLRMIVPDREDVRKFLEQDYKNSVNLTQILYLPDENFCKNFDNQINIYDDKVAILHLDSGEEYGVLIQNNEISSMHRAIFEALWKRGMEAI